MEIKEAIKKVNELKQKMKNKQYIQVRKDNTDSYGKCIKNKIGNIVIHIKNHRIIIYQGL